MVPFYVYCTSSSLTDGISMLYIDYMVPFYAYGTSSSLTDGISM